MSEIVFVKASFYINYPAEYYVPVQKFDIQLSHGKNKI